MTIEVGKTGEFLMLGGKVGFVGRAAVREVLGVHEPADDPTESTDESGTARG